MAGPHLPKPMRRLDIEGLRGLAVLLVVGFHAGVSWLSGAFVAVDVFFVLSGFFLTTSVMRQLVTDDRIDLPATYARRVWRLLPMLEGVADLNLKGLNEATQAWVELEYNKQPHSEIKMSPLACYVSHKDVGRPCPSA